MIKYITTGDNMFIEKYKKCKTFYEQFNFMKRYLKEYKQIFFTDLIINFDQYLFYSKIESDENFDIFYKAFSPIIKRNGNCNNISFSKINSSLLYKLLLFYNKDNILNNEQFQNKLYNFLNSKYNYENFKIINEYVNFKNQKNLLLNQIKLRIKEFKKINKPSEIYELITCLINDPLFNSNFTYLGSGCFKDCFSLGNYILKIGPAFQETRKIQSEYFLAPIFYKNFDAFNISIYPKVKTPVSKEERDYCVKNIVRNNIFIYDFTNIDNFGKFNYDYQNPFINLTNNGKRNLGIDNFKLKDYKIGDIVCIDYDFSVHKNDNSILATGLKIAFHNEYKKMLRM